MDLNTLLPILLSWAVELSGYPAPATMPGLRFEPHSFFVERVCGGRECTAVGWYDDRNVIYIDSRFRTVADDEFATSLIVHELTHYLQHQSGHFDSLSCTDSIAREREAYRVQNEYLVVAKGSIDRVRPAPTSCKYAVVATADAAVRRD